MKKEITYKANGSYGASMSYETHETHEPYETHKPHSSLLALLLLLLPLALPAQIKIGGNVYGGGNLGATGGSTSVTVCAGDLNKVFGGARQANVGGNSFAHIDGEHASDYILINYVFGGNDISGTIGTADALPSALTEIRTAEQATTLKDGNAADAAKDEARAKNGIDPSWNAFVRVSAKVKTKVDDKGDTVPDTDAKGRTQPATDAKKVYIGQLFGGGNGDYTYTRTDDDSYEVTDATNAVVATSATAFTKPDLARTYLEIVGGSIVYAFGGGNNATVTDSTVIFVDNPSEVVSSIKDANGEELLTTERITAMGYNPGYTYPTSDAFQIGSLFGGNNKVEMNIRPKWNLQRGKIRNVYSGGNQGDMTSDQGLLLVVYPKAAYNDQLIIDNVFGGCRRANVRPQTVGSEEDITLSQIAEDGELYKFPTGLRARTVVRGGDINNIYGGNDISGRVYGGNAVGLRCSIRGDLYGGGNGAYPYTDNPALKNDPTYGDLYYDPGNVPGDLSPGAKSVEALNAFRPNAEQVSIRLWGPSAEDPTIIHGSVYVGGNCATISATRTNPLMELKVGSNVIADKLFLANNGEGMVECHDVGIDAQGVNHPHAGVLRTYKQTLGEIDADRYENNGTKFNSMDLTDESTFATYMDGVASSLMPAIVFDGEQEFDLDTYDEYSTYIGSTFCGGNVGSMTVPGKTTLNLNHHLIVYDKVVGGCNKANVPATEYNAAYEGGLLGSVAERAAAVDGLFVDGSGNVKDRLEINLSGLRIRPMRWNDDKTKLVWNTIKYNAATGKDEPDPVSFDPEAPLDPEHPEATSITSSDTDESRRLTGGNIYGGCYESGHVNGNVVINIDGTVVARENVFDETTLDASTGEPKLYGNDHYDITKRVSGVILDCQGMDVLGSALNIFGGGYGADSEIWGSATINMNAGYAFQIFGGGEQGAIGKGTRDANTGKLSYSYDPKFSTYINMKGAKNGIYRGGTGDDETMAEAEFIYGGGFEGIIAGDTHINLGNGRVFNTFAGSCNADILGHTETIVGYYDEQKSEYGFPWIRDHIYGGNDLGGTIKGSKDFSSDVRPDVASMVYTPSASSVPILTANTYIEYLQGRVENIFGGCYGDYDYTDARYASVSKPRLGHAFVNFRPNDSNNPNNTAKRIFGAGQGHERSIVNDQMQQSSYVLIDIPSTVEGKFQDMKVFGAGECGGVGFWAANPGNDPATPLVSSAASATTSPDSYSAIIDLTRGQLNAVYGGSYEEGNTRRTVVNVPDGSTIKVKSLFGGAYGTSNDLPCDVYEAHVNYNSEDACILSGGAIYGGNNSFRRTLYGFVDIKAPVWQDKSSGYMGTVYGAGYGEHTWSQYTDVRLHEGAKVYEVYGGGNAGMVLNTQSVAAWKSKDVSLYTDMPDGYIDEGLGSDLVVANELGEAELAVTRTKEPGIETKTNTNVRIMKGATVGNYCYGGGLGATATVSGSTYVGLLGGTVTKDLYAGGTSGGVEDKFGVGAYNAGSNSNGFTAKTHAYIQGGSVRNVYGGGWEGSVGHHTGGIDDIPTAEDPDIDGETHVVIGIREDQTFNFADTKVFPDGYGFLKGVPTVQRNAYGGGEGGAVFGTTHLTLNNGYIGYVYVPGDSSPGTPGASGTPGTYAEKIDDETWIDHIGANRLYDSGNVFGGGYIDNSSVDWTRVTMWGGMVRNSLCGGGEIAAIGRGSVTAGGEANSVRTFKGLYKAGGTHVEMYNGRVLRNVFGGGKGYDNLGRVGTLYTDGYVFGQTEVYIHGGEIGTLEGVSENHGNVFGGGDIGYVYSRGYESDATKSGKANNKDGSTGSPNHWYYYDNNGILTEDCKVVVEPYLQVKGDAGSVNINGNTYQPYDYVTTDDLNTLPKQKDSDGNWKGGWENLDTETKDAEGNITDERGITIHNAVFAGGNVSSNSDRTYANATTVFGNTTATLNDVYHRDFITIGTEHIGGLYGGGNLSVVDGYRELNITNYGTDYYGLESQITLEEYRSLSNRERAYFQLQYVCKEDVTYDGVKYEAGKVYKEEEYLKLVEKYGDEAKAKFTPYGFCSIYAGRLLNTIQRADFCGVYGSRMVLQGAKDRVADVAENIDYTINRVGELSLNQQRSRIATDTGDDALHGNYFGIYSIVNYLGNLTSDVHFSDYYRPNETEVDNSQTYYSYKKANATKSTRNKGKSYNQVALASGVFLELTDETSTDEKKNYGYITGIVELDLINVKSDKVGGGFVYAKNEHRVPMYFPNMSNVILSEYNKKVGNEARTYKRYLYTAADVAKVTGADAKGATKKFDEETAYDFKIFETTGNFIHPSKTIVDDCYPINNAYHPLDDPYSEAHYWYVKGEVYVYDQYLSAYTGSATAYSKEVHLPLTITAASHGQLQLLDVHPNYYAYYANTEKTKRIGDDNALDERGNKIEKVYVNNESESYELNDVITYWDWVNLPAREQAYFVEMTYLNCVTCTIDGKQYEPNTYVIQPSDTTALKAKTITDIEGQPFKYMRELFRPSNNISHDTGYALAFRMDTPGIWDSYYTKTIDASRSKIGQEAYGKLSSDDQQLYRVGPTYYPTIDGTYGARSYQVGDIITKATNDNNQTSGDGAATMEVAYVATEPVSYIYNSIDKVVNSGTAIPATEYNALDATTKASFDVAYVCTETVRIAEDNYLLMGDLRTAAQLTALKAATTDEAVKKEIDDATTPAYICSKDGNFGGQLFAANTNYSAVSTWCALSADDREKFEFNYDALDLLIDPDYLKTLTTTEAYHTPYSDQVDVEYNAVFQPSATHPKVKLTDGKVLTAESSLADRTLTNKEFEQLVVNNQRYWTRVPVQAGGEDIYIATESFISGGIPYGRGQVVTEDVATENAGKVDKVYFSGASSASIWYYCYEGYTDHAKGDIINEMTYTTLQNDQKAFIIQGREPTETATLYVSRESDIKDVSQERVITVQYQYTYYQDNDDGSVKLANELHVINIHLQLESGVPQIGDLNPPGVVLPGTAIGLRAPKVQPGLYEVLTSGWEIFTDHTDAELHRNGIAFTNNQDQVYWYQDQKNWVAFYSKTYLGKTYSNPVPLSVANYHDLAEVMADKDHHMYVDHPGVARDSKIYINDYSTSGQNGLDLLKDLFDLSVLSGSAAESSSVTDGVVTAEGSLNGHSLLNEHVSGGANLDFILRTDIKHSDPWTPIAPLGDSSPSPCFSGTLHGDGHTISGLDNSLFGSLCGSVYNLGVTGSFTSAGVADRGEGYVENCWIASTGTPNAGIKAVFGNPTDNTRTQVVNCYYPSVLLSSLDPLAPSDPETPSTYTEGPARPMPPRAFYNGTVAYDLNHFYLNKRYYDGFVFGGSATESEKVAYKYLQPAADGTLPTSWSTGYYPATRAWTDPTVDQPSDRDGTYGDIGYVERRYADGDYRYEGGYIPEGIDQHVRIEGEGIAAVTHYLPIWPDDYIYFGQTLTYGYNSSHPHEMMPSPIAKTNGRLPMSEYNSNRVYRAPAYYRSKTMDVAHFNLDCNLAAYSNPTTIYDTDLLPAYPNMTAIDFAGHAEGHTSTAYQQGWNSAYFFQPLLDDDGILNITNRDETPNLLVYAPLGDSSPRTKTLATLTAYFRDPAYSHYYSDDKYRNVAAAPTQTIYGHLVQDDLTATTDHLLVDKRDFNAPISYHFDTDHRMWYQRRPDSYVDLKKGWETVSLPFTAELVTTNAKGEITHFYDGSPTAEGSAAKIGHEYWLREFTGMASDTPADPEASTTTVEAALSYPSASTVLGDSSPGTKEVTNTFLWDYYYSHNAATPSPGEESPSGPDANADLYQTYYESSRTYEDYLLLAAAKPYVIGFPGSTYYEFDLSGTFEAKTAASTIPTKLGVQTVTFAAATGTTIAVSDDETAAGSVTKTIADKGSYTFMPTYMNAPALTDGSTAYRLNSDGDAFTVNDGSTAVATGVTAFRPYFIAVPAASSPSPSPARRIIFGMASGSFGDFQQPDPQAGDTDGALTVRAAYHRIVVSSTLDHAATVRIMNTAGITTATFTIEPGQTVTTPINHPGIYLVHSPNGGLLARKLSVR